MRSFLFIYKEAEIALTGGIELKVVKKRACTKMPGCVGYSCADDNCAMLKVKSHVPPLRADDKQFTHRREWYHGVRWGVMRRAQLSREPLCQRCLSFEIITAARHADHVIPHRGNEGLFLNSGNLQSLCISCHSFKTMAEQKGEFLDYRDFKADA
jgi:5-methylcytosine-specific restriction endonuclease McrA